MSGVGKQMASKILNYNNEVSRLPTYHISVGADGQVMVVERDVNSGKSEYLPLIVKDGKLYVEEVKHEA